MSELNNGWISVKDRLPEEREVVMILYKTISGRFCHAIAEFWTYDNNTKIFETETGNLALYQISYWRPLPEPPKGD